MTVKFFITISLNMMKNFLLYDLTQKINNCLTNDQALGDNYQSFQTAYSTAFTRLDEAMQISRKSLLTPEIQKLDSQRVQEWRIIRSAVRESQKLPAGASADAAEFVMSLITNHGDIQSMKVTERTGALSNLCQDLTEKYAAQVEEIGLAGFAAQLSATNDEYLRLYEQRLHEWSEYTDGEVQAAREGIEDALENLCIMVASGILTQGMAPFKHFVDYVNEAIKVAKIAMGASGMKPEGSESGGDTGTDSEGGETGEEEEEEQQPTLYTVRFMKGTELVAEQQYEAGEVIQAPAAPSGYEWEDYPYRMPAEDITVNAVRRNIPGGGGGSGFE